MDEPNFAEVIRHSPGQYALAVGVPLFVASGQLANSALTGFPYVLSVPLAIVMVSFALLLVQYHYAIDRRRRLESALFDGRT